MDHPPAVGHSNTGVQSVAVAAGGRTVYFGDIGEKCGILTNYFGAHPCPPQAHPAEWMLEVIDTTPGHSPIDWHDIWRNSDEYRLAHMELDTM